MRNKYKKINKLYRFIFPIQSRLLNFKKSKWKPVKLFLLKKKLSSFFNFDYVNFRKFYFKKFSKTYKNASIVKNLFVIENDNDFATKRLKDIMLKKKVSVIRNFFLNTFRIDIFLWKLNIFRSRREVYQHMIAGNIYINDHKVKCLVFLKKGDIVHITHKYFSFKNLISYNKMFLSFCELDFYTGKIVILKNLEDLSRLDFCLISRNSQDFYNLTYYLRKN